MGQSQSWDFLRAWGREGVVSGDIFSLRQKIFKGKIIFLVCRFRRPIKTIFLCISLLHWVGGDVGIGRKVPCLPAVPGSQAICGGMSPRCRELCVTEGPPAQDPGPQGWEVLAQDKGGKLWAGLS